MNVGIFSTQRVPKTTGCKSIFVVKKGIFLFMLSGCAPKVMHDKF